MKHQTFRFAWADLTFTLPWVATTDKILDLTVAFTLSTGSFSENQYQATNIATILFDSFIINA
jgi:hypothetical protein